MTVLWWSTEVYWWMIVTRGPSFWILLFLGVLFKLWWRDLPVLETGGVLGEDWYGFQHQLEDTTIWKPPFPIPQQSYLTLIIMVTRFWTVLVCLVQGEHLASACVWGGVSGIGQTAACCPYTLLCYVRLTPYEFVPVLPQTQVYLSIHKSLRPTSS
jgi:hypothetical protein